MPGIDVNHDKQDQSPGRLSRIIERVSVKLALGVILTLSILYFALSGLIRDEEGNSQQINETAVNFLQDVIANTVPVFILFVLSYWLLREIDEHKKQNETEALAIKVADAVRNTISLPPVADKFFRRCTHESAFLSQANSEIFLVQETGTLLFEQCKSIIVELLNKGGRIRTIVVMQSDIAGGMLAFRNANLPAEALKKRYESFLDHLHNIKYLTGRRFLNLEVRFCPYPVCSTVVMVDPNDPRPERANALVRLAGFRQPFDQKLDFTLNRVSSRATFNHYLDEFEFLWLASSKFVLLTGAPHSGKTTLLSKLLQSAGKKSFSFWCLSKEVSGVGVERKGFVVEASCGSFPFATRTPNSDYDVDVDVWDKIADEIQAAGQKGNSLILIDEIGPLQLRSQKFCNVLSEVLENSAVSVIASIHMGDQSHELLERIKLHYRTSILELHRDKNESPILNQLLEEAHFRKHRV